MICTFAIVLPLHIGTGLGPTVEIGDLSDSLVAASNADDVPSAGKTNIVLLDLTGEYCDTKCFLTQNMETLEFLAKTFGVDKDALVEDLIAVNSKDRFVPNNIGRLTDSDGSLKDYGSFEKGLIEYLYIFVKNNPKFVDNTYVPYRGGSDYVINLIKYFTQIYDNVDYLTAVSIGAAESGYYQVKYMLNENNVYGGMSSSGLIRHKTIEYGILSYIRMLSLYYYGKGLDTPEKIGRVYCPTYDTNGNKVASSHWLNLVSKAMAYYEDSTSVVNVTDLND